MHPPDTTTAGPAERFRTAVLAGRVDDAVALFAVDATFHSPVVHRPYRGRPPLRAILQAVLEVFADFRYTAEYAGPDGHVLMFACRVADRECQGVDVLRIADGEIVDLTVLVRPYSALTRLRGEMAARLP